MSKNNPKKFPHNTTFSVQLPYIAGHSLDDSGDIPNRGLSRKSRVSTVETEI